MNIIIFGVTGGIGRALVKELKNKYPDSQIIGVCRDLPNEELTEVIYHTIDFVDEQQYQDLVSKLVEYGTFDLIINAIGVLHDDYVKPEKSLKDVSIDKLEHVFKINTAIPCLIAKYCCSLLSKSDKSVLAMLSARVGSISDNHLGGWYSYRASKAALNMILKNVSIEIGRFNKASIVVGLHPGTVDSTLSKPFQKQVPPNKLFTPAFSAQCLVSVIEELSSKDSGKCFAWDGSEILP